MATIPSLALIPSGYKGGSPKGTLYSVLPTDGTGDFDFTRSGNATRVNSEGLIELVSTNVPRLNYPLIDGVVQGCPSLLLEPERRNLIQYSEDFTQSAWLKNEVTVTPNNSISPDGTLNADAIIESTTSNAFHRILPTNPISGVTGSYYSFSVYVKKKGSTRHIYWMCQRSGDAIYAHFDMNSYSVSQVASSGTGNNASASITSVGNDWYRISLSGVVSTFASPDLYNQFYLSDTVGSGFIPKSYTGDGTGGFYLWGWQVEQASYQTSYIPNYGTALGATRSAETCNNAGDANTFNDSEGVLFTEISALDNDSTYKFISVSNDTSSNRVSVFYGNASNTIRVQVMKDSVAQIDQSTSSYDITQYNKIALKYKQNDFVLWINGIKVLTDNLGNTPIGLIKLNFDEGDGRNDFYGNTKQIQYFNTALNDTDLETLTSWDSFSDMATSQLYTIE